MVFLKRITASLLILTACLSIAQFMLPSAALADDTEGAWTYRLEGKAAIVTKYTGTDVNPVMPAKLGGKTVTTIANEAFTGSSVATVTLPAGLKAFEPGVFWECRTLTAIIVDSANPVFTAIDGVLFKDKGSVLVQYPAGKAQTSYAIPESVKTIAASAFDHNLSLEDISIPEGATSIGPQAFWRCSALKRIAIPAGVKSIGNSVFANCGSLAAIDVAGGNPNYKSESGALLTRDGTHLVQFPAGKAGTYTIPASVTAIDEDSFRGCTQLSGVTIGDAVTSIGNCAFSYCEGLTSVSIGNGVKTVGYAAFQFCSLLKDVVFPAGLAELGNQAFADCAALEKAWFRNAPPPSFGADAFLNAAAAFQVCCLNNNEAAWAGFSAYPKQAYSVGTIFVCGLGAILEK